MIRRSRVVIVICPSLEETVREIDPAARTVLIENAPGSAEDEATLEQAAAVRRDAGPGRDDADRAVHRHLRSVSGTRSAVRRDGAVRCRAAGRAAGARRRQAGSGRAGARAGASGRQSKTSRSSRASGRRPRFRAYLLAADVLVSPRSRGTNTPLKIYQYLRSGKPIVATRLLTHTQVLSDETAILTGATAARIRRTAFSRR